MGNHSRFRVFDIIPNASWFSKLKSMSRTSPKRKHCSIHHDHHPPLSSSSPSSTVSSFLSSSSSNKTGFHHHRCKSYYFNRDRLINDPNSKQTSSPSIKTPTTTRYKSHLLPNSSSTTRVSTGCSCRSSATVESCVSSKKQPPDSTYPNPAPPESTASSSSYSSDVDSIVPEISCSSASNPMASTLIGTHEMLEGDGAMLSRSSSISYTDRPDYNNMQEKGNYQNDKQPDSAFGEFGVAPIRIDSDRNRSPGKVETASKTRLPWSFPQGGVKLRSNSPRLIGMSKRMRRKRRKSLSESFAVVKASRDPGRDFKESMVEMIVENNIRESRELEDLLACYLSLNSEHYHELIIAVFKQIWFDLIVRV